MWKQNCLFSRIWKNPFIVMTWLWLGQWFWACQVRGNKQTLTWPEEKVIGCITNKLAHWLGGRNTYGSLPNWLIESQFRTSKTELSEVDTFLSVHQRCTQKSIYFWLSRSWLSWITYHRLETGFLYHQRRVVHKI